MSRFFAYTCFLALFLHSCNGKEKELEVNISSLTLNMQDRFGNLTGIAVCDDYMVFTDQHENTLLTAVPFEDLDKCIYFGPAGRSDETLLNAISMNIVGDNLYVLDIINRKYLYVSIDSLLTNPKLNTLFSLPQEVIPFNSVVFKNEDRTGFASIGYNLEFRLTAMNDHGEVIAKGGAYPTNIHKTSSPTHAFASHGYMTAHPDKPLVAVGAHYGRVLHIYGVDDNNIQTIAVYEPELIEYSIGDTGFRPNEKTKWGYRSLTSDKNHIYALYSGRLDGDSGQPPSYGNTIHVLDWDGNFLYQINTDRDMMRIALHKNTVYGIYSSETGADILKFELPPREN